MQRWIPTAAFALAVLLVCSAPARGQTIDPAFRADIEKLLTVTGAGAMGAQMATLASNSIVDSMSKAQPVPDRVVAVIKEVLNTEFTKAFAPSGELMSKMVDIYAAHFSHEEVTGLLAFYGTDIGRKAVSVLPTLAQEGSVAGQQWAQQNMPRVIGLLQQRLREEGFGK